MPTCASVFRPVARSARSGGGFQRVDHRKTGVAAIECQQQIGPGKGPGLGPVAHHRGPGVEQHLTRRVVARPATAIS